MPLSARAAEDLYWFGRYAERAESTARLLVVADDLVEDHLRHPGTAGFEAMQVVIDAIDSVTSVHRQRGARRESAPVDGTGLPPDPVPHLRDLVFDGNRPGTVRYSARRAMTAAMNVRDLLSADTWLVLSRLDRSLSAEALKGDQVQTVLAKVVESFLALAGMGAEGLVRDASWASYDAGRRVERAQETVRLLRRTVALPLASQGQRLVLEAVLRSRESLISHRRRSAESHRADQGMLEIALELLLVDPTNPRSVLFQLQRLLEDVARSSSTALDAAIGGPVGLLTAADISALSTDQSGLSTVLADLESGLRAVSATLEATSFRHRSPQRVIEEPR